MTEPAERATPPAGPAGLIGRRPTPSTERLLADLVPPRHFAAATFDTFRPDPAHPSQAAARERLRDVAARVVAGHAAGRRWRLGRAPAPAAVYLDGGFGVGKTHLLAALAHAVGPTTAYGTFVEYTHLVGALGFAATVEALATHPLVGIDEFELDDPGDTVLMSRLLRELGDRGVALAATSNTVPGALGEGRFAADDFRREIQGLAGRFEVLRVDGPDFRHRSTAGPAPALSDDDVRRAARAVPGATLDPFVGLLDHLATVHPSRYGALLDGVDLVALTGAHEVTSEDMALRLVVLVDRLYDRDVPVLLGGPGASTLFGQRMLTGGYRKKYYRALSRLRELTETGRALAAR